MLKKIMFNIHNYIIAIAFSELIMYLFKYETGLKLYT